MPLTWKHPDPQAGTHTLAPETTFAFILDAYFETDEHKIVARRNAIDDESSFGRKVSTDVDGLPLSMESSMIKLHRPLAVLLTVVVCGCEHSTAPLTRSTVSDRSVDITGVLPVDPTLVAFNSAACSMTNSANGAVSCSWDIGNPLEAVMNLTAEAFVIANYDCVNPKNGRIHSTEQKELRTYRQYTGVSAASLTGTNEALPLVALITDYRGALKKENACRGNAVPESISWGLGYWNISVVTVTGPVRMSCFASDDHDGCLTGIGI